MKLFLIASMVLGGSGAVAMSNEEVREDVRGYIEERVNYRMEARKTERLEKIREEGLQYPEGEHFLALTEEQQTAIIALIDEYNAANDFTVMTDEEIIEVLQLFKADLELLAEELGFELPQFDKSEIRAKIRGRVKENMRERMEEKRAEYIDDIQLNGFSLPYQERLFEHLTEEQQAAVLAEIDEVNAAYDFENMTDDEIIEALKDIKQEFRLLFEELEIEFPEKELTPREAYKKGFKHGYRHGYHHGQNDQEEQESNPPVEDDTL